MPSFDHSELRVLVQYVTDNVPGDPIKRGERVGNDFCLNFLDRNFNWDTDSIHFPGDFDSLTHQKIWIMFDLNIRHPISDVDRILTKCFKVNYNKDQKV
jgi:hypothetical protein